MIMDNITKDVLSLEMRGTIGEENYYTPERIAELTEKYGSTKANRIVEFYNKMAHIYQKRMTKKGQKTILISWYEYVITRTPAQQANRAKFRNACQAWTLLTDEQKRYWKIKSKYIKMNSQALFISKYMKGEI